MVIISDNVVDVLNRIYLEGVAKNGKAPDFYFKAKQEILKLDKRVDTQFSNNFPHCPYNWRRYNYPILRVGNYYFSYEDIIEHQQRIVRVWEVSYNDKILTESQKNLHQNIDAIMEQYYLYWHNLLF